jgi:hypothetical protein
MPSHQNTNRHFGQTYILDPVALIVAVDLDTRDR